MDDIILIKNICTEFKFGSLYDIPVKLDSNNEISVYKTVTETGTYVIELFNQRVDEEYFISKINLLNKLKGNIDIILPRVINGKMLLNSNDKYFLVYDYIEGNILSSKDIILEQCKIVGELLANIHNIDFKEIEKKPIPYLQIRWRKYLRLAEHKGSPISQILSENIKMLERNTELCNNAVNYLPNVSCICHNNLVCNRVLWNKDKTYILDVKDINYGNPYIELLNTALTWSGLNEYKVNFNLFNNVIKEYFKIIFKPKINFAVIYDVNYKDKLKLIEKYIKDALLIDGVSLEEQRYAEINLENAIKSIIYYDSIKEEIISRLN